MKGGRNKKRTKRFSVKRRRKRGYSVQGKKVPKGLKDRNILLLSGRKRGLAYDQGENPGKSKQGLPEGRLEDTKLQGKPRTARGQKYSTRSTFLQTWTFEASVVEGS